jgi:hypothetical protein
MPIIEPRDLSSVGVSIWHLRCEPRFGLTVEKQVNILHALSQPGQV